MKKILSILITLIFGFNYLTCNIHANDVEPAAFVCEIIEGYAVKSKTVTYKVQQTAELANDTSYAQPMYAGMQRRKATNISGSVSLEIIEDLLGVSAELASEDETTTLVYAQPTVPAHTTYYVDLGYRYVNAQIQWQTRNSDCSITWSGPITTAFYTTGQYVRIYE